MSTPRFLYLSPWPSGAPKSASELRALHVAKALQQLGDVEVVAIRPAEPDRELAGGDTGCRITHSLGTQIHANSSWITKVKWLLDPRLPQPHGVVVNERSARLIRSTAREFDLIWFFGLRTANIFPDWVWPRSVVDIDDVPSMFERSVLSSGIPGHARVLSLMRLWSWRRREQLLGERFTVLTVCSEADKRYLTQLGVAAPVRVVANGFERPATIPVRGLASPPRLGFIGVFDHAPNAAGVEWFVRNCWPLVKHEVPNARLRLVGRYTDGPLKPAGPDIDALGYVPNANGEMSTWAAMVVPVRTGAGTRGKIAHAFSQKCPVVSTPLGAYGYDATHQHDMLLGDSEKDFAAACVRVIRHPQAAAEMAERAWERFLTKWTWDAIRPQIRAAAEECLQSSPKRKAHEASDRAQQNRNRLLSSGVP
jgi:glycosyltransferase involved in cell wall biosynthesis